MKLNGLPPFRPLLLFIFSVVAAASAQPTSQSDAQPVQVDSKAMPGVWQAGKRTGCSTEHLMTELVTNSATREVTTRTHRYVSVSSGENYLDDSGQWQPSQDLIELMPDGSAAAVHGPCKAYFNANLNVSGALSFTSQSNRIFSAHLLCLVWYSPATGERTMIASIQDCNAELLPPNQIVWRGAFPIADVRITYTKGATETDVILTKQPPPPPEGYGPDVRLEVWHEYLNPPAPRIKTRMLQTITDPKVRAGMAEPDLADEILDFGDLLYPAGRVYSMDEYYRDQTNGPARIEVPNFALHPNQIAVAKTWTNSPDGARTYMIEAVPLADIAPIISKLPLAAQNGRLSPNRRLLVRNFEPPPLKRARTRQKPIQLASAAYRPQGCCLDYLAISGFGDYEFTAGTYFVSDGYSGGTVTFDSDAVLKSDGTYLILYGPVVCNGNAIFTSKDDDLFGEALPEGSPTYNTHNPTTGGTALMEYYSSYGYGLGGLRFRWASTGVMYCGSYGGSVTSCAFELCDTGLSADSSVSFDSLTMCGVGTPVSGGASGSYSDICSDPLSVWECKYYGTTGLDPNSDSDGDGLTLLQEYVLGTNPTIAARRDTNGVINLQVFTPLH